MIDGADLCFFSSQPDTRPCTWGGAIASHGVPVYAPTFTGTHCAYPLKDGQTELTWLTRYMLTWFNHLHLPSKY